MIALMQKSVALAQKSTINAYEFVTTLIGVTLALKITWQLSGLYKTSQPSVEQGLFTAFVVAALLLCRTLAAISHAPAEKRKSSWRLVAFAPLVPGLAAASLVWGNPGMNDLLDLSEGKRMLLHLSLGDAEWTSAILVAALATWVYQFSAADTIRNIANCDRQIKKPIPELRENTKWDIFMSGSLAIIVALALLPAIWLFTWSLVLMAMTLFMISVASGYIFIVVNRRSAKGVLDSVGDRRVVVTGALLATAPLSYIWGQPQNLYQMWGVLHLSLNTLVLNPAIRLWGYSVLALLIPIAFCGVGTDTAISQAGRDAYNKYRAREMGISAEALAMGTGDMVIANAAPGIATQPMLYSSVAIMEKAAQNRMNGINMSPLNPTFAAIVEADVERRRRIQQETASEADTESLIHDVPHFTLAEYRMLTIQRRTVLDITWIQGRFTTGTIIALAHKEGLDVGTMDQTKSNLCRMVKDGQLIKLPDDSFCAAKLPPSILDGPDSTSLNKPQPKRSHSKKQRKTS